MVRHADKFWDYVDKNDDCLKCKFCGFKFSASTSISRIKSHLSGVKGLGITICDKVTDDVKEAAYLAVEGANKRAKFLPGPSNTKAINTVSTSVPEQFNDVNNGARAAEITQAEGRIMEQEMQDERRFSPDNLWNSTEIMTGQFVPAVERSSPIEGPMHDVHENTGNALQTADRVNQALLKDWQDERRFSPDNPWNSTEIMTGQFVPAVERSSPIEGPMHDVHENSGNALQTADRGNQALLKDWQDERRFSPDNLWNSTEIMTGQFVPAVERSSPIYGPMHDVHENTGNALQTVDRVNQALLKDWQDIYACLMEVDVGGENRSEDLVQPVESDTPNAHGSGTIGVELLSTTLVGNTSERNKSEIWSWLMNDEVLNIGVYGMGGIGKSALMTHIHNQLLGGPSVFHHVYWVTVSQDFSIYKLQNLIAKTIEMDLSNEEDEVKRAAKLSGALTKKGKSVVILDDLWNYFDVEKVGIPVNVDGFKLILTTRSLDVCRRMGCQKNMIKVEPLSEEEAWYLFTKELDGCDLQVEPLAKLVAKECAGLPLGIKTLARSMRGVDDVCEWRSVLEELKESKVTQDDMDQEVFRILRFSYIRLNDLALQQCFLYCALFPEDFKIERDDLIDCFIVEGIIDGKRSRQAQFDKGHTMLNKLENACLLEAFTNQLSERCVKMHDLIRDMALQKLRENNTVLIEAGAQLEEMPDLSHWTENLVRVSLVENYIKEIPSMCSPKCPSLSTLMLRSNQKLKSIADCFFRQLLALKVLDLSHTSIMKLPDSISYLEGLTALTLRKCYLLRSLPSLALLKSLMKLDLSYTNLEEVPENIECLCNLKYLNLSGTRVKEIPAGILDQLSHLQVLILVEGRLDVGLVSEDLVRGTSLMEVRRDEVARLRSLETLGCRFEKFSCFRDYMKFQEVRQSLSTYFFLIGKLRLGEVCDIYKGATHFFLPLGSHKRVWLFSCRIRSDVHFRVLPKDMHELVIARCYGARSLLDVSSFKYTSDLRSIYVRDCGEIESVLSVSSFSPDKLKSLQIQSKGAFSRLKTVIVHACARLRNLFPLGFLPNLHSLETIQVTYCNEMEEIFSMEEERNDNNNNHSFIIKTNLRRLELRYLSKLKSICSGVILCDSLQEIEFVNCHELRRISLSFPLPSLYKISAYPRTWWELVEWDNPNAKDVLQPLCVFSEYS